MDDWGPAERFGGSDTPIYDETCAALLLPPPRVPPQRPTGGRHHFRLGQEHAMTAAPHGDPHTLAVLDPVELVVTDDAPTAEPPAGWDPDAHLDALRADPDVELVED